jgi:hypothetical protein
LISREEDMKPVVVTLLSLLFVLPAAAQPIAESLIVPRFSVDTTSPSGTTTLIAVRNLTDLPLSVDLNYYTVTGTLQRSDTVSLAARAVKTVNLRDVPGLGVDPSGTATGYVEAFGPASVDGTPNFAGDFFQVDVGDDFATGERMRAVGDMCQIESLRFLEFPLPGSGTDFVIWLENPLGLGPSDPVSFRISFYTEAGNLLSSYTVRTNFHSLRFSASSFVSEPFGSARFDFRESGHGFVVADSSVEGRFSVGVASECELP